MARPGIMIYFEVRKPLAWLPDDEKGRLFDAILEYGETGKEPDFEGMLAMAWSFIQPKLDRDQNEYDKTVLKRQYAVFCRKLKVKGHQEISFDDWCALSEYEREHMISHDITWYPTSTSTSTSTSAVTTTATGNTKSTAISTAAANASNQDGADAPGCADAQTDDDKKKMLFRKMMGTAVRLTPFQVDLLIEKMGVDMLDKYIAELDADIRQNKETADQSFAKIVYRHSQRN